MRYQAIISPETQFYQHPQPLTLELGGTLTGVQVAYRTWGQLNPSGDNGVLVCHAFTGSADVEQWWEPLLGPGRCLDPTQDFIICSNILGSCYGTTGPTSINPLTQTPYGPEFPAITIRDMVHLQAELLKALGVKQLRLAIGGSLGGMQVLEWAVLYPEMVRAIVPIAVSGQHSAWCIGLHEAQRQAIYADPHWQNGYYTQTPARGLAVARMIAMNTYRSWDSFQMRYGRTFQANDFRIANYLNYQGEKFVERFDANCYVTLTQAMDRHDLTRADKSYPQVLQSISQPTLVIGIDTDILYPPSEQEELAELIPNAQLTWLNSPHGHDAFLINMTELNQSVLEFRQRQSDLFTPTLAWH
ncbi:homoserine O-acetyltransferase [Synechococcus sp. PCC 6312]|uniref:homoserine O-acetyltransferase MetX n=1 Tax=Synechococcus sp. (strain ATCC 27167 / PCC 6312) TaxID=195253 RepID=UPI00029EC806|nr:homoserine O-acetyltransferase [Synechococcus sp. PCC 6312]AFY61302.1 homoserine O-acetyltransferase [Synechococcus sp. PCC 6312]